MNPPRWMQDATEPTRAELDQFLDPVAPTVLAAAREATRPTHRELARLRPRTSPARRPVSPAWLGVPVAAVLGLLVGRWVGPTTISTTVATEQVTLFLVHPGEVVIPVRGVRVLGDGSVRVDGRTLGLDGDLEVQVEALAVLVLDGRSFVVEDAILSVRDGRSLEVLAGTVRDGEDLLRVGDRWPAPLVVGGVIPPEPEPVAVVSLRSREVARTPVPAQPDAVVDAEVVAPEVAPEAPPEAPPEDPVPAAPTGPTAIGAWRDVLAALERGPSDAETSALLDTYRRAWPDSPFALEAEALSLLARSRTGPPAEAVAELEAWLAAHPTGPRGLDVHAAAAFLWREGLADCARAAPHDTVVAAGSRGARRATAEALLGLCALAGGDAERGRALLHEVDADLLDPALRRAVVEAR